MQWADKYSLFLWRLRAAAKVVYPGDGWRVEGNRFKYMARGAAYVPWVADWLEFLDQPGLRRAVGSRPELVQKIQWPFLSREFRAAKRLEILKAHYGFVNDRLSSDLRNHLFDGTWLCLARFHLPTTGEYAISLGPTAKYWQEGELELRLDNEALNRCCAFLHFTVTCGSEISIGCLQGAKPVDDLEQFSNKELFSRFKREMHGMRHKSLLLFALQSVARCWRMTGLRAVSAEAQLWSEKVHADYNSFWMEEGGVRAADGMFDLPVVAEFEDRPRKRAMYRKRYECLQLLEREIGGALGGPSRPCTAVDLGKLGLDAEALPSKCATLLPS